MSDREVIKREAVGSVEGTGDGRTLELRVVPFGVKARVTDNGRDYYDEQWEPGCFDRQAGAPNRVLMNVEHEQGFGGVVGFGKELRNAPDGFEGTFRMSSVSDGDKALELVNEGILTGVSLEAEPIESVQEDGVVKRVKARLINVALCRTPAFEAAQVLAVREGSEEAVEESADAHEGDPDVPAAGIEADAVVEELGTENPAERNLSPDSWDAERDTPTVDAILQRVGYEPLVSRAVTSKPWNGSAARFSDEEYKRSCLIDRGGDAPVKERCSLPVLEPNGDINKNALGAAAGRLNQTGASADLKAKAARKLIRYYNQADMDPPPALRAMAGR